MLQFYILIAILFLIIIILVCLIYSKTSKLKKTESSYLSQQNDIKRLTEELQPLIKYKDCVNAEKEAAFILSEAKSKSDKLISDSNLKYDEAEIKS